MAYAEGQAGEGPQVTGSVGLSPSFGGEVRVTVVRSRVR